MPWWDNARLSGVLLPAAWAMFHGDMMFMIYLGAPRLVRCPTPIPWLSAFLVLVAAMAAGCAHSSKSQYGAGAFEAVPAPLPPLFLNGPMALLLTNVNGFRAHVVLESGFPPQTTQLNAGELMGRGGKLLFAPAANGAAKKPVRAEDSAFIWDVSGNRGYVLNDPLQGYAPVSSSRQFTNVTFIAPLDSSTTEKIAGYLCPMSEVTVTAEDGTATSYRVWRPKDLQGIPLRIACPSNGVPITLTLSKVRLEPIPNDLFLPPRSFTKYDSPEAMMAELFLRKHNLSRKQPYQPDESEPGAGRDTRMPNRPN
jgi:hypothetical protein